MRRGKRELWVGVIVLGAVLAVLLAVACAIGIASARVAPAPTVPPTTPPTDATLPPSKYSADDFVWDGAYLSLKGGGSATGVDVSYYQKQIDWQQVRDAGIEFAIVRLGYRGYESGTLFTDERVYENLLGAKQAGLRVGAYFYSQAVNAEEAAQEARYALEILDGFALDMPLAYDWEFVTEADARTDDMDAQTLTQCMIAFCDTVRDAGYEAMVYFNPALAERHFDLAPLYERGYPLWLAHYTQQTSFPYAVQLWQYSCTATVPGIEGRVDLNILLP